MFIHLFLYEDQLQLAMIGLVLVLVDGINDDNAIGAFHGRRKELSPSIIRRHVYFHALFERQLMPPLPE